MKILYLLFFLFSSLNIYSQCPDGDVIIRTQAEVDAYKNNYYGCEEILGNLELGSTSSLFSDITDVSSFEGLKTIKGSFRLANMPYLESLDGFSKLEKIEKSLTINTLPKIHDLNFLLNFDTINDLNLYSIPQLKTFEDLKNVNHFNGGLFLGELNSSINASYWDNKTFDISYLNFNNLYKIENLDFLKNLTSCSNIIKISCNDNLKNIFGLSNLEGTVNYFTIRDNPKLNNCSLELICDLIIDSSSIVTVYNNVGNCKTIDDILLECDGIEIDCPMSNIDFHSQKEIDSFRIKYPKCTEISGDISILERNETPIDNLNGLLGIKRINGNLKIRSNSLVNLKGLDSLHYLSGDLSLINNKKLIELKGLNNIKDIGRLYIEGNGKLQGLEGLKFEQLEVKTIEISNNDSLKFINQISLLNSLENLSIRYQNNFTNFAGWQKLKNISGDFRVQSCNSLENFNGLPTDIQINSVFISQNDNLQKLENFNAATKLDILTILGNNSLKEFNILNNIKSANKVSIKYNISLKTLGGSGLIDSLGVLEIKGNKRLINIDFFDNDIKVNKIIIEDNSSLSECAIEPICSSKKSDNISIMNNGTSCNSYNEIIEKCMGSTFKNPHSDIYINSQEDIDSFILNYPEADSIFGGLFFKEQSNENNPISDLSFFSNIKFIDSTLSFDNCRNVSTLDVFSKCNFESLKLLNQDEIDSISEFINIDTLETLTIRNCDKINSLKAFKTLKLVKSKLELYNLPSLITIQGLSNLKKIGYLNLSNLNINSLIGFNSINQIRNLEIRSCNHLKDLKGFINLEKLYYLELTHNDSLEYIFERTMVDSMSILRISYNKRLKKITGLDSLKYIKRYISISENNSLQNLNGLSNLEIIDNQNLSVFRNHNLKSLGLKSLKKVGREIIIRDNQELVELNAFNNLLQTAFFTIKNNPELNNISSIFEKVFITRKLKLYNNYNLSTCNTEAICNHLNKGRISLIFNNAVNCNAEAEIEASCGFAPRSCPTSDVYFLNNNSVEAFNTYYSGCKIINGNIIFSSHLVSKRPHFDSLIAIVGALEVKNLVHLDTIRFNKLQRVERGIFIRKNKTPLVLQLNNLSEIRNNIEITRNSKMDNISYFNGLINFGKYIRISKNTDLKTISGFNNLKRANALIIIQDNNKLDSISGFNNLEYLNGIHISNNKSLVDLSGFDHDFDINNLTIRNNSSLSNCSIKSFCNHLENNGYYKLENNDENCNSKEEILLKCISNIETGSDNSGFIVYPNPTNSYIYIQPMSDSYIKTNVCLYDISGAIIKEFNTPNRINISDLNSGLYILIIKSENSKNVYKFSKINN